MPCGLVVGNQHFRDQESNPGHLATSLITVLTELPLVFGIAV